MASFNKRYLESLLQQLENNDKVVKTLEAINKLGIPFPIAEELHVKDIVRRHAGQKANRKLSRSILNKLLASEKAAKKNNAEALRAERANKRRAENDSLGQNNERGPGGEQKENAEGEDGRSAKKGVPTPASFDKSYLESLLAKLKKEKDIVGTLEIINKLEIPYLIAKELHVRDIVHRHAAKPSYRALYRSILNKLKAAKKKDADGLGSERANKLERGSGGEQKENAEGGDGSSAKGNVPTLASFDKEYLENLLDKLEDDEVVMETLEAIYKLEIPVPIAKELCVENIISFNIFKPKCLQLRRSILAKLEANEEAAKKKDTKASKAYNEDEATLASFDKPYLASLLKKLEKEEDILETLKAIDTLEIPVSIAKELKVENIILFQIFDRRYRLIVRSIRRKLIANEKAAKKKDTKALKAEKEEEAMLASFDKYYYLTSLLEKLEKDEDILENLKAIEKMEIPFAVADKLNVDGIVCCYSHEKEHRLICRSISEKMFASKMAAKDEAIALNAKKTMKRNAAALNDNIGHGCEGGKKRKAEGGESCKAKQTVLQGCEKENEPQQQKESKVQGKGCLPRENVPTSKSFDKCYLAVLLEKLDDDEDVLETLEALDKLKIPAPIAEELHVEDVVNCHVSVPANRKLCHSILDKLFAREDAAKKKEADALRAEQAKTQRAEKAALNENIGHGCEKQRAEGGESCNAKQDVLQGCMKKNDYEPQQQKESQVRGKGCLPRENVPTPKSFDKRYLASLLEKLEEDEDVLETLEALDKLEIPASIAQELDVEEVVCYHVSEPVNRKLCNSIIDKLYASEMPAKKEVVVLRAEENKKRNAEKADKLFASKMAALNEAPAAMVKMMMKRNVEKALNKSNGRGYEGGKKQKAESRKSCDAEQDVLQGWGKEIEFVPEQQKENQVQGEGCIAKEDVPTLASFDKSYLVSLLEKLEDDEEVLETLEALDKLEIPVQIAKELHVGDTVRFHIFEPECVQLCRSILAKLATNEEAAEKNEPEALRAEDNNKQSAEKAALDDTNGHKCDGEQKKKAEVGEGCNVKQDVLQGWGEEIEYEPEQQKKSQVRGEGCTAKEDVPTLASFDKPYLVSLLKKLDDDEEVLETLEAIYELQIPVPIAKELEVVDIVRPYVYERETRQICHKIIAKLKANVEAAKKNEAEALKAEENKKRRAEKAALNANIGHGCKREQKLKVGGGEGCSANRTVPTPANFDKSYLEGLVEQLENYEKILETLKSLDAMDIPFTIAEELQVAAIVRRHAREPANSRLCRSILDKLFASEMAAKKTEKAEQAKTRRAEKAALKQKANGGTGSNAIKDVPTPADFDKSYLASLLGQLNDDDKVLETLEAVNKLEIPVPIAAELQVGAIVRRHMVRLANRSLCRSIISKLVANEEAAKKKENADLRAEQAKIVRDKRTALRKEKNAVLKECKMRKRQMEMDLNANNTNKYEEKAAVPEKKKKNTIA